MQWLKYNYLPFFNADGGAGGGGGEPPAGDPPAGDPPAGDPPAGDPPAGDPPALYKPEGLADHFFGETNEGTIDNMKKALDGYRDRDASIPEDAAAYAAFNMEAMSETLQPHMKAMAEDPLFAKVSEQAKELKVPVDTFQQLTTSLYQAAADAGILEAPIDIAAEQAALTPEHARNLSEADQKVAREKRMNENFGWLDLQAQNKNSGISEEMAEHVKAQLGDSAFGHQFLEAMRSSMTGQNGSGGPGGNGSGSSSGDAYQQLEARRSDPKNNPNSREFDLASYNQFVADLQAWHEANPNGRPT